jgi:hypothetical protein
MSDSSFTVIAEPALEKRIASDLRTITATVQKALGPSLSLLLLGGGRGRGEGGGVRSADGTWMPYNDYDLFAVVQGVSRLRMRSLRAELLLVAAGLEKELGVEVELSPISKEGLKDLPFTMMWCELFAAHRVLAGDPAVLSSVPPMLPANLPLVEAARYLTNRSALLLWALSEPLPPERVWKFIHKAWLASGAAFLIGQGQFTIGYAGRQRRLEKAQARGDSIPRLLAERHGEAARARLEATAPPPPEALGAFVAEARDGALEAWRGVEERRIGKPIRSWAEYAELPGLFAEPLSALPALAVRHLLLLGGRGLLPFSSLREHPRTRVTRALPGLLEKQPPSSATSHLLGGGADWADAARRCLALWKRAN